MPSCALCIYTNKKDINKDNAKIYKKERRDWW